MRHISFALTTDQVRQQTKTVTRRLGWAFLKPGDLLQPIVKGQGIPKGGHVEKIGGPIRVVSVRPAWLGSLVLGGDHGRAEVDAEGFPNMNPLDFLDFFCRSHRGCRPQTTVTRIEFEYTGPHHG